HRETGGRRLEGGNVLFDCSKILPPYRGVACWPPVRGHTARGPGGGLPRFPARPPRPLPPPQPPHALPHRGRQADLALFPVIDDRQPYLSLALDLLCHSASDRRVKDLGLNGLALLSGHEHLQQLWGTC